MITNELVSYIKKQFEKDIPKELITVKLVEVGWKIEDINEAFDNFEKELISTDNFVNQNTKDIYREPIGEIKENNSLNIEPQIKAEPKVWVPQKIEPIKIQEERAVDEIPKSIPVVEKSSDLSEVQNKIEDEKLNLNNNIIAENNYDLIPNLIPKKENTSLSSDILQTKIESQKEVDFEKISKPVLSAASFNQMKQNDPRISGIRTDIPKPYKQEDSIDNKKSTILKWSLIILFIVIILVAGFYLLNDRIKLSKIPFVKKDVREVIVEMPNRISDLKNYKFETELTISSPSFSKITTGLSTGENSQSKDRDFLKLNTKGQINKNSISKIANYNLSLGSSIFPNNFFANVKYDENNYYVNLIDFDKILGENISPFISFYLPNGSLNDVVEEIADDDIKNYLSKINSDKIASTLVSGSLDDDFLPVFTEFINTGSSIEKEEQNISGIDTYYYEITPDKTLTKKFTKQIIEFFASEQISNNQRIDEIAGSANIDSLSVWVGKNDNLIYKYSFSVSIPLSKIVGLNDSGIANDKVSLNWQTIYSDFDVPNEITVDNYPKVDNFLNQIREMRLKNEISNFSRFAKNLFNQEGGFGRKPNTTGNCINPNPGSLFSPNEHLKGASNTVGEIAGSMNNILEYSFGVGSCFSSLKDWAIALPLPTDTNLLLCADNKGNVSKISLPITGPSCN